MNVKKIKAALRKCASREKAALLQRFFKTGPGEYGEGDIFLGVIVPPIRKISKAYSSAVSLKDIAFLLKSSFHEERLIALFMLIEKFDRAADKERQKIYKLYLKSSRAVNNWDLVDLSAPHIVGNFLLDKQRTVLYRLARSKDLWERRIAVLATFTFIKEGQFNDTLGIGQILLKDREDLIHKAVGWMLREIGKRDIKTEEAFLNRYAHVMPRTMLRYAIERFPEPKRRGYLARK